MIATCQHCVKEFEISIFEYKTRVRVNRSKNVFCSKSCAGTYNSEFNHPYKSLGKKKNIEIKKVKEYNCTWCSSLGIYTAGKQYACDEHRYILVDRLKNSNMSWADSLADSLADSF